MVAITMRHPTRTLLEALLQHDVQHVILDAKHDEAIIDLILSQPGWRLDASEDGVAFLSCSDRYGQRCYRSRSLCAGGLDRSSLVVA